MTEFINETEIEQLSEQELRAKFYEIFNALAQRPYLSDTSKQMLASLYKIQIAIYRRKM